MSNTTEPVNVREKVGYLIFRAVDIGNSSWSAVEECADDVIRLVAEEIAQAIEADDGFEHKYERDYAARIAREHGKEQ